MLTWPWPINAKGFDEFILLIKNHGSTEITAQVFVKRRLFKPSIVGVEYRTKSSIGRAIRLREDYSTRWSGVAQQVAILDLPFGAALAAYSAEVRMKMMVQAVASLQTRIINKDGTDTAEEALAAIRVVVETMGRTFTPTFPS